MASHAESLDKLLEPFQLDLDKCDELSQRFLANFTHLAAESTDQFLPTPISESILRPIANHGQGRHLAIDFGGTYFRVGFVELLGKEAQKVHTTNGHLKTNGHTKTNGVSSHSDAVPSGRLRSHLEKSWPISNQLKKAGADSLFTWIGERIVEVVTSGLKTFHLPADQPLATGVTFSFPVLQHSLSEALVLSMGKGFAIPPNVDLGSKIEEAYMRSRQPSLPPIQVTAIANDSVSTLVSFIFDYGTADTHRAAMGLILGTGTNATIPLKLNQLHHSKWPKQVSVLPGEKAEDAKITVNTEWGINGTLPPMKELGLVSVYDNMLSSQTEIPGFQPLEYMTAGRYLGELGRLILVDYMTNVLGLPLNGLPGRLAEKNSLATKFLSQFQPLEPGFLLQALQQEFPESMAAQPFVWTEELVTALHHIAKAVEARAAGIIAAATVALLTLAGEFPTKGASVDAGITDLGVGYTGGCIVHFENYLTDCQNYLDGLVTKRFGEDSPLKVTLSPCHDGGITGAGVLVEAASSSKQSET